MENTSTVKKVVAGSALLLSGLLLGGMIASSVSASAATGATGTVSNAVKKLDPTKSIRPDEHLLSGSTASKVRAAALAKYPNATIQRVETDSEGVYEAHIVTSAGKQLIVQVGKDFAVTGVQDFGGPPAG